MAWPEARSRDINPDERILVRNSQTPIDCTRCDQAIECARKVRGAVSELVEVANLVWHDGSPSLAVVSLNEAVTLGAEAEFWEYVDASNDLTVLARACMGGVEYFNPETNAMD